MDRPAVRRPAIIAAVALLAVAWVGVSVSMTRGGHFEHEPNFMSLKGSAYGRTIAFAMRGPADLYWHRGSREDLHEDHHHDEDEEGGDVLPAGDVVNPAARMAAIAGEIKREFEEHEAEEAAGPAPRVPAKSTREWLLRSLKDMKIARYERTNHRGDTDAMHAFMKGEAEKRLKLSYEMDPTNLLCYGSYFFFLSESIVRLKGADDEGAVIAEGERRALDLARRTANYCLQYPDEPTAAITGASACHDALTVMLRNKVGTEQELRGFLEIGARSLQRFDQLKEEMIADGRWEDFSEHRRLEMDEARTLVGVALLGDRQLIEAQLKPRPGEAR
ncbi:hypothetical protein [Haloferula sp. A504]|uniref:hypothetical protein n=1 Tax=Haloferula sp. A504 TaxID=3373601 RepID=UPI0031C328C2|nr:hypothetical protein [Verrucomicrobiaceae bacterium E54]